MAIIGVDIDGTLTDIAKFQLEEGKNFFGRKAVHPNEFDVKDMFECSQEEENAFWKRNFMKYCIFGKMRDYSDVFTKIAHNNDDKIIIITSRKYTDQNSKLGKLMRYTVEQWLKHNGIKVDKIVYCSEDKMDAVKTNKIDIMLEDNVKNIEDLSKLVKVVCMNTEYNKNYQFISENNVKRISSMKDAYSAVKEFELEIMRENADENEKKLITVRTGKASIDRPWLKYYDYEKRNIILPKTSIYEYLKDNTKKYSNMIAIDYFGNKISYKKLFDNIEKYARSFVSMGVNKGDVVTLCLPNVPEAVYMFYALNKIGAIANMVHPLKSGNEIKLAINTTKSKLLVAIDNAYKEINSISHDISVNKVVIVSAGDSMPFPLKLGYKMKYAERITYGDDSRYMPLDDFINQSKKVKRLDDFKVSGDDTAVIMYTGGTSGFPKGVELSNNNFNRMVYQQKATAKHFGAGDKMLTIMPVFHGFGLCSSIHMPLSYGITTILIPKFDSKEFYKLMSKYKPNHVFGVPKLWKALMNDKNIQNMDLSFMKYIVSGGENMKDGLEEDINNFFEQHNCYYKLKKGYGSTEAVAGTTLSDDNCNEIGSVGIPLICNNFKVVKPGTEEELDYYQKGEICISGPTIMKGYLNNNEETLHALRVHEDGKLWYHTGDSGYITKDGMIYYADRLSRMYVSGGFNIYPPQIEKIIEMCDKVEQCAVVGINHPYKDIKVPQAYLILKNGEQLDDKIIEEISNICKQNLDAHHQPFRFVQVTEFPTTKVGKTDYNALQELSKEDKTNVKRR